MRPFYASFEILLFECENSAFENSINQQRDLKPQETIKPKSKRVNSASNIQNAFNEISKNEISKDEISKDEISKDEISNFEMHINNNNKYKYLKEKEKVEKEILKKETIEKSASTLFECENSAFEISTL